MTAFQNLNRMRQCQLSSAGPLAQHLLASAKMGQSSYCLNETQPSLNPKSFGPKAMGVKPQLRVPYGDWFVLAGTGL